MTAFSFAAAASHPCAVTAAGAAQATPHRPADASPLRQSVAAPASSWAAVRQARRSVRPSRFQAMCQDAAADHANTARLIAQAIDRKFADMAASGCHDDQLGTIVAHRAGDRAAVR